MANNEGGVGQTELFSGWSCVVHQPCDDVEPSDLPSTIDMAAFSTNLSVEPSVNSQGNKSSDSESESESDSNVS